MKTKLALSILIIFFLFSGCTKNSIKENACPEAYIRFGNHSDSSYVWAPNIFTPNGDGTNDIFYVRCKKVTNFSCVIKNGAGKKLFDSGNYTVGWDGTNNGKEVKDGVYKIIVSATINGQAQELGGEICLLRNTDKYCPGNLMTCTFDSQYGDFGFDPNYPTREILCQ